MRCGKLKFLRSHPASACLAGDSVRFRSSNCEFDEPVLNRDLIFVSQKSRGEFPDVGLKEEAGVSGRLDLGQKMDLASFARPSTMLVLLYQRVSRRKSRTLIRSRIETKSAFGG